ncbi:MAG TPA: glycosyltransferase family 9 protein, partial [Solidesulfovibrio sp.]|nr:O-linked N-acetylglucosamine transferase [Desulfovibrio sp.]HML62338.1 glycosyltransferase family 9 protein [Solidesulfovibrio sp.]
MPETRLADRRRSLSLARLLPLLARDDVACVSLQMGEAAGQIRELGLEGRLADSMGGVRDFMDTAAIVAGLDLVVSVDTAVVHLAGALGRPVWVLSRFDACWRWLCNRETNPWYPGARVFGQPAPGDWDAVVARVAAELARFARERQ